MTENLLNPVPAETTPTSGRPESRPSGAAVPRPEGLPDKFWDAELNAIRFDALIKSYLELERKLSGMSNRQLPSRAEEYAIQNRHELISSDPDVNRRLHAAGFSQEQAQLVYDLASEKLLPMLTEIAAVFDAEHQVDRLIQHFGSEQRWRETARQIDAWGRKNLPDRVFEALATTYEGVVAMHRMMSGNEPGLIRDGASEDIDLSETRLKQLMRDPRYWRDQDPVVVEKVRSGFRRLYQS